MKDSDWSVWVFLQSFISSLILNLKLRLLSHSSSWRDSDQTDHSLIQDVWSLQKSCNMFGTNNVSTLLYHLKQHLQTIQSVFRFQREPSRAQVSPSNSGAPIWLSRCYLTAAPTIFTGHSGWGLWDFSSICMTTQVATPALSGSHVGNLRCKDCDSLVEEKHSARVQGISSFGKNLNATVTKGSFMLCLWKYKSLSL